MRFRRLYLTRFGHFTDHVIDFGSKPSEGQPDFHVIYGLNEAGKTTFLNAVLRLLFRFPRQDAEPYDFLHGADLEVGADVEDLPGRPNLRVRRTKTGNALLDDKGDRLPDDFFASALARLGEEEYRMIFSLDRQSVIAGAEDIKKAGGEAGRLLFAAHAGLSSLTASLNTVEKGVQEIFVAGGKKQRVPQIKRRIKEIEAAIRERDITAAKYERLSQDVRKAAKHRDNLDERVRALRAQIRQVDTQIRIRDLGAALIAMRQQLAEEFAGCPNWLTEPHEKTLSQLNGEFSSAVSTIYERRNDIEALMEERDGLENDHAVIALEDRLEMLEPLRGGAKGALQDYARRRGQALHLESEMIRRLSTVSVAADGNLREDLILEHDAIDALQKAERKVEEAESKLALARRELEDAENRAKNLQEELKNDLRDPPLQEAVANRLQLLALDDVADTAQTARSEIERRRSSAAQALSRLSLAGRAISEVPVTDLTATAVREDAVLHSRLLSEMYTGDQSVRDLEGEIRSRTDALGALEKRVGAEAIDIGESRARRDVAWRAHRATLDDTTAEAFEQEMLRHDKLENIRFNRASDVGQAIAVRRELDETRNRLKETQVVAEKARNEVRASQELHSATLRGLGLPERMTRTELANWLGLAETARQEARSLEQELEGHRKVLEREAAVGREVRDLLPDLVGLEDSRTVEVATEGLKAYREARTRRATALRQIDRMQKDIDQRRRDYEAAEGALKAAQTSWRETVAHWLPEEHGLTDVRPALPALSDVSRTGRDWRELIDRAKKMRRDAETFIAEVARLADELGIPHESFALLASDAETDADFVARIEAVITCERGLQARLGAACDTRKRREAIAEEIDALEQKIESAEEARQSAEEAMKLYRARFPETIPIKNIVALDMAIGRAREATRLRAEVRKMERELSATISGEAEDVDPIETAREFAAVDLEGERERLEEELETAQAQRNHAGEAYGGAKRQLDAVTGDDEIARLEAERAALQEEFRGCVFEHARKRMGLFLARRAIEDYRRENRSELMQAASEAFARLTGGRYVDLTSRSEDGREVLIARRAEDDATRRAEDMSAGTRMQLYFALRVAAYLCRVRGLPACPFIADDVFESFDDYRTQAACEQMRGLGLSGQSIYLTHHSDVGLRAQRGSCGSDVVQFLPGVPEEDKARLSSIA